MNTSFFDDVLAWSGRGRRSRSNNSNPFEKERSSNPFSFDEESERGYKKMGPNDTLFPQNLSSSFDSTPPRPKHEKTKDTIGKDAHFAKLFGRAYRAYKHKDYEKETELTEVPSQDSEDLGRQGNNRPSSEDPNEFIDPSLEDNKHIAWDGPCSKIFFIWMYFSATVYGSIAVVSTFLLLLAFRYNWFESERERDLFQLSCLGFAVMFSLIVACMWVFFKEKQYGWAFVVSLPSLAVATAVVIILQAGDIGPSASAYDDPYGYDNMYDNAGMEDMYYEGQVDYSYDANANVDYYDANANGGYYDANGGYNGNNGGY